MASVNPQPIPQRRLQIAHLPPTTDWSDAELVEAVSRGDGEAAGAVWDRYSKLVRGIVRSALGFDASVEDVVQEVFVAFLRCTSDIRDGSSLRSFLASVATGKSISELRKRRVRRWVTLSASGELPDIPVVPADIANRAVLQALYRILQSMPHRRRMAFVLRHLQYLEVSDIASTLQVSQSTVKREITRAAETIEMRARSEPALSQYMHSLEEGRHV